MNENVMLELLTRKKENLKKTLQTNKEIILKKEVQINTQKKVKELLLRILYIKKHEIKLLENVVNSGLRYIYSDRKLIFKIEFSEKNNKITPEFYLNGLKLKKPFVGDGGGIISVIGLLLFVIFSKMQKSKILLLDEVESMVDITATEKLFDFLEIYAKENDMYIILITHKNIECNEKITEKIFRR